MAVNNYVKPALTSLVYNVIQLVMTQVTKVRNFPRFSNRGDFLYGIFEKFLENHFL